MDTRINAVIALLSSFSFHHVYAQQSRPNIIMILADDMGYSDIGCYGGEILTPNIDSLAREGVRMTQFYNTSRSCPTRASLMTGLYQHQAGIGWMSEDPFKGVKDPKAEDRTECNNVAKDHKKILDRLTAKWDKWAEETNVLIPFPGETY